MPTDCERLSENAQGIFKLLEAHFPPDPWKKPQWTVEGKVFDNGWFDLRKGEDRKRLTEKKKNFLGYLVEIEASRHRKDNGRLDGFTNQCFTEIMRKHAEILLILNDLDFQIETGDIVDECEP